MKKQEDARLAVLRESFLISVPSEANGKSFTAGFVTEVDWEIKGRHSRGYYYCDALAVLQMPASSNINVLLG